MGYFATKVSSLTAPLPADYDKDNPIHPSLGILNSPLGQILVTQQVFHFAKALKRKMPWIEFGVTKEHAGSQVDTSSRAAETGAVYRLFEEVMVYIPGQRYALGRIGYKDYGLTTNRFAYGVMSRKIRNRKVGLNYEQHYMSMSEDVNRAVKAAIPALIGYSLLECGRLTYDEFRTKVRGTVDEAAGDYRSLITACSRFEIMEKEIRNLIRQGASFITPEFIKASKEIAEAEANAAALSMRKVSCYYINIRQVGDVPTADILTYKGEVRNTLNLPSLMTNPALEQVALPVDDLSDDIRGKLAVLMSMSDQSYTPGIGYKEDDSAYWVEREMTAQ